MQVYQQCTSIHPSISKCDRAPVILLLEKETRGIENRKTLSNLLKRL